MLFNSLQFLVFFIIVYGLYLILSHRWQNRMLILASCLFYSAWNWKFLPIMFVSISADYFCSQKIYSSNDPKIKKKFLFLSIFVNLVILGFFKYFNFFIDSFKALVQYLLPSAAPMITPAIDIILPLGISFYTFEAISYVVDVYRGVIKPAERYGDYLLFVIYFPHLIAGPIMRAKDFLPQIVKPRTLSFDQFYEGSFLFFWGLFEKIFVADNLARIVNPIFASESYDGGKVLIALYAFAFQIFCDFDGYSNMARGLGKMMGFDITINFNLPYFSTNPVEFWKRWHISLSSWLRDYLYIPLGGNREGKWRTHRNLLVTMLLGGLWHGAQWHFVFWGFYQGALLMIYRLLSDMKKSHAPSPWWVRTFKIILFFHLTCLGWLFFRAESMSQAWAMLYSMMFQLQINASLLSPCIKFSLVLLPLFIIQLGQYRSKDLLFLYRQHWFIKIFVYALFSYLMIGWGVLQSEEFIYFQF